jgi:hypothetical protein
LRRCICSARNNREAIPRLERLIEAAPHKKTSGQVLEAAIGRQLVTLDDKLYEKLANCWIAAGELHVQSETAVQRGIDKGSLRDPGNAELMLGVAHYNQRSYEDAVPHLEQARRSDGHRRSPRAFCRPSRRGNRAS